MQLTVCMCLVCLRPRTQAEGTDTPASVERELARLSQG